MNTKTKTEKIFELSAPFDNPYQGKYPKVLFVCSAGILRSATAAYWFGSKYGWNTRAAGSALYALVPLSVNLITWADTIYFVAEENYQEAKKAFEDFLDIGEMESKSKVLDIPDIYNYRDPDLIYKLEEQINAE